MKIINVIDFKSCKNNEDQLHNENGPAVIIDDTNFWYKNGQLHRIDGPAIEWKNGDKEYYLNGLEISEKNYYLNKQLNASISIKKENKNKNKNKI
jgi:hypothetical protein